jgi:hypothetical protein
MTAIATNTNQLSLSDTVPSSVTLLSDEPTQSSMIEKLQRFDLQSHGGEMMSDKPIGREFAAKSK